jgi:hypothetical protein
MKKNIFIIVFTMLLTFITSLLFEVDFIAKNPVRYALVIILILIEIYFGIRGFKNNTNQL